MEVRIYLKAINIKEFEPPPIEKVESLMISTKLGS